MIYWGNILTEALFYEKKEGQSVRCKLCPHNCLIEEGDRGYCGVRGNRKGILYALTRGKVISAAVDPVEKKPLYHFLPGSRAFSLGGMGCNLACRHCQNHEISQRRDEASLSRLYDMTPESIVRESIERDCELIAWTYNEPTIWYEYIRETAIPAGKAGVKTALITNGVINSEPLEELLPLIDAYRVDIKGFTEEFYRELTGSPFLKIVKKSAEKAFAGGCHVELVTNIIPGMNDDEQQLEELINWIGTDLDPEVPWHVTAYHPAYKMRTEGADAALLEKIRKRGLKAGLKNIFLGNVYSGEGTDTFCPQCGKTLIRRFAMSMRENNIVKGSCPDCGYKLKMYQGSLSSR